jgi:hypothetical protein
MDNDEAHSRFAVAPLVAERCTADRRTRGRINPIRFVARGRAKPLVEKRIDALLSRMTPDEKLGQMSQSTAMARARPELDAWAVAVKEDPKRQIQATVFDASDGVRGHSATTGYSPSVAKSADGKLWFLPRDVRM